MKKKICLRTLVLFLFMVLAATAAAHAADSIGLDVQKHTRQELIEYSRANYPTAVRVQYDREPVLTAPYDPGVLSQANLEEGLRALNYVRYLAGLSYDVVLDASLNEKVQAGVLIDAVNNKLTHYPDKPEGMSDELYDLGYSGTSTSNLGAGYSSLTDVMINGWIYDSDSSNIDRLGHRRWVLNPKMGKTGFGYCNSYSGMYALDRSNTSAAQTMVAWPAQLTPTTFMNRYTAWSLSLDQYVSADNVTVTITRRSDGRKWTMAKENPDGYFNVDSGGYGQGYCIIFQPGDIEGYYDGDIFDVKISGALDKDIEYSVEFIDLIKELGMDKLTVTAESLSLCEYTKDSTTVYLDYNDYFYVYWGYSGLINVSWVNSHEYKVSVGSGSGIAYLSFDLVDPNNYDIVRTEKIYFTVYQGTWVPYLDSVESVSNGVQVSWKEPYDYEEGYLYEVLRKTGSGELVSVGVTDKLVFVDKTVEEGVTYTYTVRCLAPDKSIPTSNYDKDGLTIKHLRSGWHREGGSWYYYAAGVRQTGWIQDGSKRYYTDASGVMQTGWLKIDGTWYYFASSGIMQTGWLKDSGKWYYFCDDGSMAKGWQQISGKWYYFNAGGDMVTGWKKLAGKWYYFNDDGYMTVGWKKIDGYWYYFTDNGAMATGWIEVGGKSYYLKPSGVMAAGEWCKGWWLNKDGVWTYPYKASWKQDSKGWYYQDTSGWFARNITLTIDDKVYTFNSRGYLVQ